MSQFGRPILDISTGNWNGTFADIDEISANDSDFGYSSDNIADTYETKLSSIADPLSNTNHIIKTRVSKSDGGVPNQSGGNSLTVTISLYQGTTLIQELVNGLAITTWADLSYTLSGSNADSITDYSDLRIRYVYSKSGGSPANRRGFAVSWSEFETPDAAAPSIVLVVQDSVHNHSIDNVVVTHKYSVTVQDSVHTHTSDNIVLSSKYVLVVQDTGHAHTVDNVDINVSYIVTVNDSVHDHSADSPTLSHKYFLTAQDTTHNHIADNVVLSNSITLVVQDSVHSHSADNIVVSHKYTLVVDDTLHNHTADNVILSNSITLVVQDGFHSHIADTPVLESKYVLLVDDIIHNHTVDNITLSSAYVLNVNDTIHNHTVVDVILDIGLFITSFIYKEENIKRYSNLKEFVYLQSNIKYKIIQNSNILTKIELTSILIE